jgi:hypothetical protein
MTIKKLFSLSLLSLLLCQAVVKAHLLDVLMPWTWRHESVYSATALLTLINHLDSNSEQRYKTSALRAYILASQVPAILNPRDHSWGMRDDTERSLTAVAIGAETLRSFYGAWIRSN